MRHPLTLSALPKSSHTTPPNQPPRIHTAHIHTDICPPSLSFNCALNLYLHSPSLPCNFSPFAFVPFSSMSNTPLLLSEQDDHDANIDPLLRPLPHPLPPPYYSPLLPDMTLSSSPDYLLQHAYMIPQGFPMATYSNAPYDSASYPSFGQFMPSQPDHFISPFQLPFPAAAAPLYPPPSSQPRPRSPSPPKNDLPPSPWSFPNFADGSNLLGNLDPYMQGQILEEVENSGLMSTLSEFAELDVPAPFGLPDDVRHAPEQWSMVPAGPSNPSTPSAITPFETPMDVFHRQFPEIVTDSVWRPPEGSSADAIQDEVLPLPEASGLELANPEDFFPPLQPDPLTFPYLIPVPFQHQQQGDVSQHTRFDEDGERIELQEPLHYALHGEDLPVEDEDDSDFEGNITSSSASSIDQDEAAKQVPEEERRPEIVRVPTPPLPSPGSLADYRWPVGPLRRAFATMRDAIRLSGNFAATFQSLEHDLYDAVPSDSEDVDVADDDDDMLLDLVALAEGDEKIERVVDDEELQIYEEPVSDYPELDAC